MPLCRAQIVAEIVLYNREWSTLSEAAVIPTLKQWRRARLVAAAEGRRWRGKVDTRFYVCVS